MSRVLLIAWCLVFGLFSTCFGAITYDADRMDVEAREGYFTFRYPVFRGDTAEEKAVVTKVNNTLKQLAKNEAATLQTTWESTKDEDKANFKSKDVDYKVTYLENKLASIVFTTTFAQGDRDALFFQDGWTFDLTTAEPVGWQKILSREDANKLQKDYVLSLLRKGAAREDYVIYWDTTKLKDLPTNYYVSSNGQVHFIFNPYTVGPASSGVIDLDTNCTVING